LIRRRESILKSSKVWLAIVALAGILTAAVVALSTEGDLKDHTISYELFRFSLTVILGGVIAFVFRMAETRRQVRELRQRELRDFHRRTVEAYNEAKKIRRLLYARSHQVDGGVELDRKDLDDLMCDLQSTQLDFEALRRETETNHKLFSDERAVEQYLKRAESYLRKVLKVHEKLGRMDPVLLPFGSSERLALLCFFYDRDALKGWEIAKADCDSFTTNFANPVLQVRKLIVGTTHEVAAED
jgi:hypothetical protein